MAAEVVSRTVMLRPGFVCLPGESVCLCAVISSGVAVAMYDAIRKHGGLSHYAFPYRENKDLSTVMYACPSIVSLVRMFEEAGSNVKDLTAHLYGGASNPDAPGYVTDRAEANVQVGMEVLQKLGIRIAGKDVGGSQGRKIVFHTGTGETVVARVDRIRVTDWYPDKRELQNETELG